MKLKLNSTSLKWVAIITMIIDHIGAVIYPYSIYPDMLYLRIIGRIAFPIFAFLLVEGYKHTRDVKKYGIRLLLFAAISEVPFDMAFFDSTFTLEHQNVFFTLALGLLALYMYDHFKEKNALMGSLAGYLVAVVAMLLNTDYGMFGVLLILLIYVFDKKNLTAIWIFVVNGLMVISYGSEIQLFAVLSIPFIMLYNGEKGKGTKYLFYVIYPLHIVALILIRMYVL